MSSSDYDATKQALSGQLKILSTRELEALYKKIQAIYQRDLSKPSSYVPDNEKNYAARCAVEEELKRRRPSASEPTAHDLVVAAVRKVTSDYVEVTRKRKGKRYVPEA